MNKRKGNAASADFIIGLVFSIIGSVFVIIAVCFAIFQAQFERGAEETSATATSWLFPLIFGLIGLVFAVIGIIMSVLHARKKKKEKWLRDNGRKIHAEVTGGRICYNYTVNNRHPFQLECRYEDTGYGQVYLFSSGLTWLNPNDYIGSYVDVYVDSSDMSRYFVDTDSLKYRENNAVIHDYR